MSKLQDEINYFVKLFQTLQCTDSRNTKMQVIRTIPDEYKEDWQFILEVLDGKYKLGYTFVKMPIQDTYPYPEDASLKTYMQPLWQPMKTHDFRDMTIAQTCVKCATHADFIEPIVNRTLRLGIGKSLLAKSDISPMLAKTYDGQLVTVDNIYVTEKLDGNRCIAAYDFDLGTWRFYSRNGKEKTGLKLHMCELDVNNIYDGELISESQSANSTKLYNYVYNNIGDKPLYNATDFYKVNGQVNRLIHNEQLIYCIFDIMSYEPYSERRIKLNEAMNILTSPNVRILPTLAVYNGQSLHHETLDVLLDVVTDCGAEGLMLNMGGAPYTHNRTKGILKYKKVHTMDMMVECINTGTGKYEGVVGAITCHAKYNDMDVICNVGSGISDEQRISWMRNPSEILNKIVEIAYFDLSQNERMSGASICSLRFPRLKSIRVDKDDMKNY